MNLEMPSPAEADSLRTILLIVLGMMILTIPVVCVIVVSKVVAQRKQRPAPTGHREKTGHDAGGADQVWMAAGTNQAIAADSANDDSAPQSCRGVRHPAADDAENRSSYYDPAPSESNGAGFSDGGSSSSGSGGCSGGGDSGGGRGSD